jgi:ketosteroid isomerase-like protein
MLLRALLNSGQCRGAGRAAATPTIQPPQRPGWSYSHGRELGVPRIGCVPTELPATQWLSAVREATPTLLHDAASMEMGLVQQLLGAAALSSALMIGAASGAMAAPDLDALKAQVADAERAFARSMAERRLDDFARHVSDHAVFFGGTQVLRGKAAVVAGWKAFYEGPSAPFSWAPDQVEVLPDGQLAHSTGLVRGPDGKPVARFNSVWRLERGSWLVVFDKGSPLSEAERKQP